MQIRRTAAALMSAAALGVTGVAMATPAQAAPANTAVGSAAGLAALVTQIQTGDIDVTVVEVENVDVNVTVQNVLNDNTVLTDLLKNNDLDINGVVIVDNELLVLVDMVQTAQHVRRGRSPSWRPPLLAVSRSAAESPS